MKKFFTLIALYLLYFTTASAQEDTSTVKQMDEVVVTATRTERKLGNVAVPVQLISNKIIQQSGSLRLTDVLQEQTGLFITSGGTTNSVGGGVFGNGVQIQGLSPDYTMILLDGEPVIGRNGGVLDLSRLAVGNIKKIEIVKGPSSSLYGSEAMGGVINIITDQAKQDRLDAGIRYGRFNSVDANLTAGIRKEKYGLQFFGNRNSSDGYDLDKTTVGNTVDPWHNYTGQLRFFYQPAVKTKISLSARYFNETQSNFFQAIDPSSGNTINITGDARVKDMNLNPVITQQFSDNISSSLRFYFSRYQFEQRLVTQADKTPYYYDFFQQDFYRVEDQTDIKWAGTNLLSAGGGIVAERLNTTRYSGKRGNDIQYLFLQNEWKPVEQLTIIGGARYDHNSAYKSRISPKLAAQYKFNDKFRVNVSYGAGFKAPDFRQLFLNFTNNAGGDYTVYGTNEVTIQFLQQQLQQGILSDILPRANQLALLKPEISRGLNMGFHYDINDKVNITTNFFRNDIDDLIMVDVVAYKNNSQHSSVYSYFNVNRAFTEGAELQAQYFINKYFQMTGGYQFLITADKDELDKIKSGNEYARDIHTNSVYVMDRSEYAGLPNRSRHMVNLKLFYDDPSKGWSVSLRGIYRSRWGTTDKDGNAIINRGDEFAKGFLLANISAAKTIKEFRLQAGIDNFLNYKDTQNLPGFPGIQPYISIMYSFIKKNK
jgi:outer membrane receptor for ferrienterochelin and colicins